MGERTILCNSQESVLGYVGGGQAQGEGERRGQALRVSQLGEGKGHCRRRREMIVVVKLAASRWARWVRNATRSSVRAT